MKTMKKSMFLTTVLMVVLLVVALSTATFAWYTANTNVGATRTAVTSAASGSASLVIDNQVTTDPNETRSSVNLTMTGTNRPMVYTSDSAVVAGTTTYSAFIAAFKTFTRDANGKFASAVEGVAPGTLSAVSGTSGSSSNIVLTNVGGASMASVNTTVTIEPFYEAIPAGNITVGETVVSSYYTQSEGVYTLVGGENTVAVADTTYYEAGHDYLRVAVFAGADESSLVLKGIYGAGTAQRASATGLTGTTVGVTSITTAVGAATLNSDLSDASAFKASGSALDIAGTVASMSAVYVKVVVWYEGVSMNNVDAGKTAAFSMTFSGTTAS